MSTLSVSKVTPSRMNQFEQLLDPDELSEESCWQGYLKGQKGSCRRFSCKLSLNLLFCRGVLTGTGLGLDFPHGDEKREFEIFGSVTGGFCRVRFAIGRVVPCTNSFRLRRRCE